MASRCPLVAPVEPADPQDYARRGKGAYNRNELQHAGQNCQQNAIAHPH